MTKELVIPRSEVVEALACARRAAQLCRDVAKQMLLHTQRQAALSAAAGFESITQRLEKALEEPHNADFSEIVRDIDRLMLILDRERPVVGVVRRRLH